MMGPPLSLKVPLTHRPTYRATDLASSHKQPCAQFVESIHFPLINTLLTVSLIRASAVWAFGFWHLVMKLVKQCLLYTTTSSATKSLHDSNRPETWRDQTSSLWPHASRMVLHNSRVHTTLVSFAVWYLCLTWQLLHIESNVPSNLTEQNKNAVTSVRRCLIYCCYNATAVQKASHWWLPYIQVGNKQLTDCLLYLRQHRVVAGGIMFYCRSFLSFFFFFRQRISKMALPTGNLYSSDGRI